MKDAVDLLNDQLTAALNENRRLRDELTDNGLES